MNVGKIIKEIKIKRYNLQKMYEFHEFLALNLPQKAIKSLRNKNKKIENKKNN